MRFRERAPRHPIAALLPSCDCDGPKPVRLTVDWTTQALA
jgi:hypothetical protein